MKELEFFVDLPQFPQAKCAELDDKDMFFSDTKYLQTLKIQELKRICASCIHQVECKDYAIRNEIAHGVWGGTTSLERSKIINEQLTNSGFVGISLNVVTLHRKGLSRKQIALSLGTSSSYISRTLAKLNVTEQGVKLLHQQTKDSSEGLR